MVKIIWQDKAIGGFPVAIDGVDQTVGKSTTTNEPASVSAEIMYELPEKWTVENNNNRICNRILVFQKTGTTSKDSLEKAAASGKGELLARALDIGNRLDERLSESLKRSRIVDFRTISKGSGSAFGGQQQQQVYYEFDVVGSDEGSRTADPYYYLVSATILPLKKRLYVFILEGNNNILSQSDKFDRRNILQQLRSSFTVVQQVD